MMASRPPTCSVLRCQARFASIFGLRLGGLATSQIFGGKAREGECYH
jgi:hypothetical protein